MTIYEEILKQLNGSKLLVVSKKRTVEEIEFYYNLNQRDFGENHAQELLLKKDMHADIRWHFIGHLQTNKVKQIIPYTYLIHSIDSYKLLKETSKQAKKINKVQKVLLEISLTNDENKTGIDQKEIAAYLEYAATLDNIKVIGLMAMGPHTDNEKLIDNCFKEANIIFDNYKNKYNLSELSMGMSSDYKIALKNNSTIIRVGSKLF
jgi:pyridoxal phosphate enzyme (YggS family)